MLAAIEESRGSYRGVCIADDTFQEDDFAELHAGGIRGVRFNFVKHLGGAPDLALVERVVAMVEKLGWHLVVHVNAEDLLEFDPFFSQFALPIVVDHMGRVPTSEGIEQKPFQVLLERLERENWWVKVCGAERISTQGPPFHDAVPFARALIEVAPDRVLWGTDWPHPNIKKYMPDDGDLVDLLPLFSDSDEILRKILVDNPARLYEF